jgi:cell division initiation protein
MKITPLDIEQVKFRIRFRGYDRREVDDFLDSVTVEYEGLIKENSGLREKVASLEIQLNELRNKEAILTQTLTKAQQLVEEMKEGAQKEASLIVKQAELQAEEFMKDAREESSKMRGEILDLQKQKMFFLDRCRSAVESFQKLIEMEIHEPNVQPNRSNPGY